MPAAGGALAARLDSLLPCWLVLSLSGTLASAPPPGVAVLCPPPCHCEEDGVALSADCSELALASAPGGLSPFTAYLNSLGGVYLKMNLSSFALGLLLFISLSYAEANVSSSTPLYSSSSSLPTTMSSPSPMSSKSTQDPKSLLHPSPVTNSPPNSSLPQQNQTQPSVSTTQTEDTELIQEEEYSPFGFSDQNVEDPIRNYEWEAAARRVDMVLNMTEMFQEEERARFNLSGLNMEDSEKNQPAPRGMAIALLKPKGEAGETQGISKNAIALFLWVCGILLCLFVGIYCAHSRGYKKEPFIHHRLNEDAFDEPALSLDRPQHYDWFFHETDGYVYPTPTQIQLKPMQVLSVPDLKQPSPGLETSPEKPAKPETGPDTKEVPRSPVKLECLSPASLGNLI